MKQEVVLCRNCSVFPLPLQPCGLETCFLFSALIRRELIGAARFCSSSCAMCFRHRQTPTRELWSESWGGHGADKGKAAAFLGFLRPGIANQACPSLFFLSWSISTRAGPSLRQVLPACRVTRRLGLARPLMFIQLLPRWWWSPHRSPTLLRKAPTTSLDRWGLEWGLRSSLQRANEESCLCFPKWAKSPGPHL